MEHGPTYQRWWELHVRVARGERLSPADRVVYDAGRRELEDNGNSEPLQNAKQAREELRDLEVQRRRLEQRRQELDAEITAIESALARKPGNSLAQEE